MRNMASGAAVSEPLIGHGDFVPSLMVSADGALIIS